MILLQSIINRMIPFFTSANTNRIKVTVYLFISHDIIYFNYDFTNDRKNESNNSYEEKYKIQSIHSLFLPFSFFDFLLTMKENLERKNHI